MPYSMKAITKHSLTSPAARACRRIMFTYCESSIAERGFYHADRIWGAGSCCLIKFEDTFFCLTAKHVLENNEIDLQNLQNESPFWVWRNSQSPPEDLTDILFPKYLWNINELITEAGWNFVDFSDVVLIEMFPPFPHKQPDYFFELNFSTENIVTQEQFYEGQLLSINGYPFEMNDYTFENVENGHTHKTNVRRRSLMGVARSYKDGWSVDLGITDTNKVNAEHINGMSGGIVCNVGQPNKVIKWAGMITLHEKPAQIRFIPAYILQPAITNYKKSKRTILDPSAQI